LIWVNSYAFVVRSAMAAAAIIGHSRLLFGVKNRSFFNFRE